MAHAYLLAFARGRGKPAAEQLQVPEEATKCCCPAGQCGLATGCHRWHTCCIPTMQAPTPAASHSTGPHCI